MSSELELPEQENVSNKQAFSALENGHFLLICLWSKITAKKMD